ncbi:hypothetical protein RFH98_15115, partial [Acinetobacter johnsonii]|nr:hypothetical protein [Acinetobacter johnsonii]
GKDSYAAPLAKTVFSLPFVVICNSAIQALYGHDQRDREAFHPHSSLIPNVYVQQARQQLQDNVKSLSIKHLERK